MGVGQYKNAATPLRTGGINTIHQHFQKRYRTRTVEKQETSENSQFFINLLRITSRFHLRGVALEWVQLIL